MKKLFLIAACAFTLAACSNEATVEPTDVDKTDNDDTPVVRTETTILPQMGTPDSSKLDSTKK